MKRIAFFITAFALGFVGTGEGGMQQPIGKGDGWWPNAYGPGIHQNRYGQAVTLEPQGGGVPGEELKIKPDTYGPGIHMDQYGRPVRERPWPW